MNKRLTFFLNLLVLCCFFTVASGAKITKKLYINKGNFQTVDTSFFPYYAFNSSNIFKPASEVIKLNIGDTLQLTVTNNDVKKHSFKVKGINNVFPDINAADSITHTLVFDKAGVYIYLDDANAPDNSYLGLAGMICVADFRSDKRFYWSLRSHQKSFNNTLANDSSVNWKQYKPDYFTINSLSFPDLQKDSSAVIEGKVGDTMHIFVSNLGPSIHSIHFHGFHARVIASTNPVQVGWLKDTYLLEDMQSFILELVPDKPGLYPVHDHNLVTLSGGGRYPNGMMLMMNIKE